MSRCVYKKAIQGYLTESLDFCRKDKGLELYCYVLMTNHMHLIAKAKDGCELSGIIRDFKKYTSKQVIKAISTNPQEGRKEWILKMF